jgi:hypothetical protein
MDAHRSPAFVRMIAGFGNPRSDGQFLACSTYALLMALSGTFRG